MRRPFPLLAVMTAAVTAAPAAAATEPQPLVDLAPQATAFLDHVGHVATTRARRAGDSTPAAYRTSDGLTVSVVFSGSYTPDPEVAQSYVDFLAGLPHGSELGKLHVYIATPAEVRNACGGVAGTLACYDPTDNTMTVPGEQTANDGSGVTTSYVIAHEYGHHVAAHRSNSPFFALNWGPKYWASREQVCINTIEGRLAPGDEGENYLSNPGEAWADTFAHLKYPNVHWQFTRLLKPTTASKAAARRDVLQPWLGNRTATFHGSFVRGGANVKGFRVVLHLDGGLRVALKGPAGTNYDIGLSSLGVQRGATSGPTSGDVYSTRVACREVQSENVTLKILRRKGYGPFTATVTYAG